MNKEMQQALNKVYSMRQTLSRCFLIVHNDGIIELDATEQVKKLTEACPFRLPPSTKQLVTMGLAMMQEEQNNTISQEQIDEVCQYFDFTVSFDKVQEYNRKYI